jgi:hypothetical protein
LAQQESIQPLAQLLVDDFHVLAGAAQIAHRFLLGVGNPDRRQLAGTVQPSQAQAVSPVGLDPFAGLARNQRWRHHRTVVTGRHNPPVQLISARASLVAQPQPLAHGTQPRQQSFHCLGTILDLSPIARLPAALVRHRYADLFLVHIQPDVLVKLCHDLSSSMRLCASLLRFQA